MASLHLSTGLLRNFFKIAFRSLKRDPLQTGISVLGLLIALICFLSLYSIVRFETSYDKHHTNYERIYRMNMNVTQEGMHLKRAQVGPPLAPVIQEQYEEVEYAIRFRRAHALAVSKPESNLRFYENRIYYTDPAVFKVFSYPFLYGDPEKALLLPNHVVLSHASSIKYFGNTNPVGKTLTFSNEGEYIVSGVLKKLPANSSLTFDFLLPFEAFKVPYGYPVTLDDWRWASFTPISF